MHLTLTGQDKPEMGGHYDRNFHSSEKTKNPESTQTFRVLRISLRGFCGLDETRTRDPLRDRQVF